MIDDHRGPDQVIVDVLPVGDHNLEEARSRNILCSPVLLPPRDQGAGPVSQQSLQSAVHPFQAHIIDFVTVCQVLEAVAGDVFPVVASQDDSRILPGGGDDLSQFLVESGEAAFIEVLP